MLGLKIYELHYSVLSFCRLQSLKFRIAVWEGKGWNLVSDCWCIFFDFGA